MTLVPRRVRPSTRPLWARARNPSRTDGRLTPSCAPSSASVGSRSTGGEARRRRSAIREASTKRRLRPCAGDAGSPGARPAGGLGRGCARRGSEFGRASGGTWRFVGHIAIKVRHKIKYNVALRNRTRRGHARPTSGYPPLPAGAMMIPDHEGGRPDHRRVDRHRRRGRAWLRPRRLQPRRPLQREPRSRGRGRARHQGCRRSGRLAGGDVMQEADIKRIVAETMRRVRAHRRAGQQRGRHARPRQDRGLHAWSTSSGCCRSTSRRWRSSCARSCR